MAGQHLFVTTTPCVLAPFGSFVERVRARLSPAEVL